MKKLYELKDMLCEELDRITGEISKNKLSQAHLELVYKLTDTIKNIDKISMLEDEGYSQAGNWEARINGVYGHHEPYDYDMRNSRARNGRHGVSYRHGYSRDEAKGEMLEKLEDMMYDTDDPKSKENIRKCMETLKQM